MGKQQLNQGLYIDVNGPTDPKAVSNFRRIMSWARQVSPTMTGASSPIVGVLPMPVSPQDAWSMWAGSPTVIFSSGFAAVPITPPFPNCLLCATFSFVSVGTGAATVEVLNTSSLSAVQIYGTYNGAAISGTFRVSGFVLGY